MQYTFASLLISLILHMFPHSPMEGTIRARQSHIAQIATEAAEQYQVPLPVLMAVGWRETHLGTDPHEGGNWGAPRPGGNRHIAGTAADAARILARGFTVCGSWGGSMARFRSGACSGNPVGDRYKTNALRTVIRLYQRTGTELPAHLRR